jgi:hypothetical protein
LHGEPARRLGIVEQFVEHVDPRQRLHGIDLANNRADGWHDRRRIAGGANYEVVRSASLLNPWNPWNPGTFRTLVPSYPRPSVLD